jgi:diphthine methyl ester synthase
MALYIIGLGLGNEKDITLKGLETIKKCSSIYLESYTSKLQCSKEELEKIYGKKIILADRDLVEKDAETILKDAKKKDTAFLVVGDPFGATTHSDLYLRAKEKNIEVKVINNASILNAIGIVGLELYKFGRTVSIPFDEKANSFYDFYKKNDSIGLHTLFLLDLSPKDNKFLTIKQAIERLLKVGLDKNQLCIGCAAISSEKQQIKAGKAKDILDYKFTEFPQCIIIPSKLHFIEEDMINQWK